MPFTCPVCRRYSSKYDSEKSLLTHLKDVHPKHQETLDRIDKQRPSSYGVEVGKTKPVI